MIVSARDKQIITQLVITIELEGEGEISAYQELLAAAESGLIVAARGRTDFAIEFELLKELKNQLKK